MSNTIHTVNFMHRELKQLGCEVGCVINRGLLHSVNSGALGSKVFGKTVRETQQLSEILTVDQFIVNDVVRNHSENVDSILDPWQLTLDPSTIVADKGFEGFSVYLVVRQNQE